MDIAHIKQRARELTARYNPEGFVPFPFVQMAQALGDVDLLFLDVADPNVSGAVYLQQGRYKVVINQQKPKERQYFTIAHEFGHYVLHKKWLAANEDNGFVEFSDIVDGQGMLLRSDAKDSPFYDPEREREANNFAAELIMPPDKVRQFWNLTHDIERCAAAFEVSKIAMAIQLERMGVL